MRILFSPLDWGLGHATRCIPIIRSFLQNGSEVYVACNATQQRLLEKEFANVCFLPLEGYDIHYAFSKRWFAAKILQQIPKIIRAIRREHQWLKKAVNEHQIEMIVSDNRYGFYHNEVPSVFITHQLFIQTPYAWLSHFVQKINYRFVNRFSECWVPDYEGEINLAGSLSHPRKLPAIPLFYIGLLSRFKKKEVENHRYKWLLVLSGPEPQRTLLENALIEKFSDCPTQNILMVRGLPASSSGLALPAHFTVFNHLPAEQLEEAFLRSEYIISRAGYSTVMDIIALQKKSVLIPTPGQTEQEFLAKHLAAQHWCMECPTIKHIEDCIKKIERFNFHLPKLAYVSLDTFIADAILRCKQEK